MKHTYCGSEKIVSASLSARRAWIETISELEDDEPRLVALRKEGVD